MYPVDRAGQRLRLRELHPDDVDAVFAVYGSAEATQHMSFEPRSREQVGQIIDRATQSATTDPRTEYALAVTTQDDGDVIGFARLALDPHQPQGATIGFALRPDTWGAGRGLETVHLLLDLGFDGLGLHRIWGARSPLNTASARTLTAAGLIEEGVIREHVRKNGQWRDSVVHAILDREWPKTPRTRTV
ncbi:MULTISPECIES: GNAT family protein [unclassified Streptomyces]|uniref:GNAT family N-acetyltransferase n=1 Tax=unclassified Streptomyces TaxID=2593676 RepID=UPI000DBA43A2|nr:MULTISPECIES: GNAT family protein [unclassified Streptomyces]MYT68220.1 GNAT family N-acetyltransferase [Streptomyces sp. SID8367]RAJ76852.1 RimJ/RimL family protein N-acetyltransferase [Streptomyces sp. PsTaAH-137]